MKKEERFLRLSEVCLMLGVREQDIRALVSQRDFPAPVYVNSLHRWVASEVQQFAMQAVRNRDSWLEHCEDKEPR